MEDFSPVKPSLAGIPVIPDIRYHVDSAWAEGPVSGWYSPAAGLKVRDLFDDGEGHRVYLARLDPGAEFPAEDPAFHEHVFVLAGKIRDGQAEYGAGTYLMNPPGSSRRLWTHGGCLVLIHHLGPASIAARADLREAGGFASGEGA
jgi:anti-sigma factor ChrR (cupin superfamily)